VMGTPIMTN